MLDLDDMTPTQARRLRELADSFQPQFLVMLRTIGKANNGSLEWLLSSLASRDRYRSPLLDRCCKLLLVVEALDEGEREVATRDTVLAKVIRRMCRARKVYPEIHSERIWLNTIRNRLKPWVLFFLQCWQLLARWRGRRPVEHQATPLILLDVFVGPDAVDTDGHFSDRYYQEWEDYLPQDEIFTVKYLPILCGFEDEAAGFKTLRESQSEFLILDDFLTWRDYLWIAWRTSKMASFYLPDIKVVGVSILSLLKEERRASFSDWSGMLALLSYRFAQRSAEAGLCVDRLIDWSENQVVDRGLVLGFHKFHTDTQVVAYKGYPLSENFHPHLCPSTDEMEAKVHPRETWVIGKGNKAALRSTHSEADIHVGPALRYKSIFSTSPVKAQRSSLLVGLSVESSECEEMLTLLKTATPYLPESLPVHIKPHPMLPREKLTVGSDWNHDRWLWVEGEFSRHLRTARVLCTNVSSTALEALVAGVPVLLLGRRGNITWHPIPKAVSQEAWALCFSAEELVSALEGFLGLSSDSREAVSGQIRDEYLSEPNAENVRSLLGMTEE